MISKTRALALAVVSGAAMLLATTAAGSAAQADRDDLSIRVRLSGYQEDPQVISTKGNGRFSARLSDDGATLSYTLSYAELEGNVAQAHIHLGGRAQSGGIMLFICTNQGNGPAGTPLCPAAPATVTGTATAANIIGPAGGGIAAGEFAEFVAALRNGVTYVNVHSSLFPAGEIRAQLDHKH